MLSWSDDSLLCESPSSEGLWSEVGDDNDDTTSDDLEGMADLIVD